MKLPSHFMIMALASTFTLPTTALNYYGADQGIPSRECRHNNLFNKTVRPLPTPSSQHPITPVNPRQLLKLRPLARKAAHPRRLAAKPRVPAELRPVLHQRQRRRHPHGGPDLIIAVGALRVVWRARCGSGIWAIVRGLACCFGGMRRPSVMIQGMRGVSGVIGGVSCCRGGGFLAGKRRVNR